MYCHKVATSWRAWTPEPIQLQTLPQTKGQPARAPLTRRVHLYVLNLDPNHFAVQRRSLAPLGKPISIRLEKLGEGNDPWGGYRAGFIGTTTLTRRDFGISYNLGPASESMELEIGIEGIRK